MKPVATSLGLVFAFPSNSCNCNRTDHQRARTATAVRSFFGPVRSSLWSFCGPRTGLLNTTYMSAKGSSSSSPRETVSSSQTEVMRSSRRGRLMDGPGSGSSVVDCTTVSSVQTVSGVASMPIQWARSMDLNVRLNAGGP